MPLQRHIQDAWHLVAEATLDLAEWRRAREHVLDPDYQALLTQLNNASHCTKNSVYIYVPQVQLKRFLADHFPMLHAYIVTALHASVIPDVAQIPAKLEVRIQHAPGLAAIVAQLLAADLSVPSFIAMAMQLTATADVMSANVPLLLG